MQTFIHDLRQSLRALLARPGFTLIAVLTLALGIGANTAIYSLYEQLVLRQLPVPVADQLVTLSSPVPKWGSTSNTSVGPRDEIFSYPMARELQARQTALAGIAAHRNLAANLAYAGNTRAGQALLVSGNYFELLGLQPALGRLLAADDDAVVGEARVAVLSHAYWSSQLGAAADIVGKSIKVNGQALTIVGVAPAGFDGNSIGSASQVFVPLTLRWVLTPGARDDSENRRSYWVYLFGRLKPGASIETAQAGLAPLYARIINEVDVPLNGDMDETAMARLKEAAIRVLPGGRGQSAIARNASTPATMLLAVATLVLLIACLNTANLLLARASSRSAELALRASIGADRTRLLRDHLSEALVLALLGGLASLPVAALCLRGMVTLMAPEVASAVRPELDPVVLRYAMLVALATVLVFGLYPALHAAATNPIQSLRAGSGAVGSRVAMRFRSVLATAQIALSMVALVVAGLFIASLQNLSRVDTGMQVDAVASFALSPARNGYGLEHTQQLYDEVLREVSALPGVAAATTSLVPLLTGNNWGSNVSVQGYGPQEAGEDGIHYNAVDPGFFAAMGMKMLAGREFSDADSADRPLVAVVNRAFVERFRLGADVVGRRMAVGSTEDLDIEIVGVVADARYDSVRDEPTPQFYLARRQQRDVGSMVFYVRSRQQPEALLQSLAATVARIDPDLPVENLSTLPQQIRGNLEIETFVGTLSAAFAVLATLLAAIGVYGVLSYSLAQRTREFGLKLALGAAPMRVQAGLLAQAGRMFMVGGSLGLLLSLALGRAAQALLYGLGGNDPGVLASAAALLGLIALIAAWWPARRAARVDPLVALRWE